MITSVNWEQVLVDIGAIVPGHFVFTEPGLPGQGDHGDIYVAKRRIKEHPGVFESATRDLAAAVDASDAMVEVVCGLESLGATLARPVSARLAARRPGVQFATARKKGDLFVLGDGHDELVSGKRVGLLDDVVRTGGSLEKAIRAVEEAGGKIVSVTCLFSRGKPDLSETLGFPRFTALGSRELKQVGADECRRTGLCAKGVAINTDLGHGAHFLSSLAEDDERRKLAPTGFIF